MYKFNANDFGRMEQNYISHQGRSRAGIGTNERGAGMNKNKKIIRKSHKKYAHAYMRYACEKCGYSWNMYLEKGIEEGGENHKPSPFCIKCPWCEDGIAMDVTGLKKLAVELEISDTMNYFANKSDSDCGVAIFGKNRGIEHERICRKTD